MQSEETDLCESALFKGIEAPLFQELLNERSFKCHPKLIINALLADEDMQGSFTFESDLSTLPVPPGDSLF